MKLLLDTQCWLWWFAQPERLNEDAIAHIADETNELWFSVASIWEIGIKVSIGKLPLPEPIDSYISTRMVQLGARYLEITAPHALQAAALPLHHRDPFDRMLIAQAQIEGMMLVSADPIFKEYSDLSLLWAAN
ncbi:type II toxin-antitoxin system VapC family toxin [Planktothrix sp. FACHB-1355]|uniref:Type II toxin-antitoxin system VapC family toxin n=1 Tax=Aerosakkonema funiforme FACHB-1375 TaxID=2949571 RepID=A0A926VCC3_9CYAN|nr:PIN domain-containing protein [Aerosakkonema funiforme]MBD2180267.1 type II toxin-antitoxin system VapC family toxin [Aerosakkonema funiforme FACHB-1375]MBD3558753.1 type II toxin-antitoxin system VapC family toxin [Planktothrix sp. FACHB-1355]